VSTGQSGDRFDLNNDLARDHQIEAMLADDLSFVVGLMHLDHCLNDLRS
jgi:hypothetical protein